LEKPFDESGRCSLCIGDDGWFHNRHVANLDQIEIALVLVLGIAIGYSIRACNFRRKATKGRLLMESSATVQKGAKAKMLAPRRWPSLERVLAALVWLVVALLLGILSLAAVSEIDCRRERIPILKLEDGISNLVTEQKYVRCRFRIAAR
jgi:hypothetical protein